MNEEHSHLLIYLPFTISIHTFDSGRNDAIKNDPLAKELLSFCQGIYTKFIRLTVEPMIRRFSHLYLTV